MLLGSVVKNYKYEQEILDDVTYIPSFMKIHQLFEQLELDRLIYTRTRTHTHTHTHTQASARARARKKARTHTHTHRTWWSWNLTCFLPYKVTVHKKRVPCELQEELYSVFSVLLVSLRWWEIQISSYLFDFEKLSYLTQLCVRWILRQHCEKCICRLRLTIQYGSTRQNWVLASTPCYFLWTYFFAQCLLGLRL